MKKFRSIITALLTLCIVQGVWAIAPGGALGGGGKAAQSHPAQEGKVVAEPAQPSMILSQDQSGMEAEAPINTNTSDPKPAVKIGKTGQEAQGTQEVDEAAYRQAVVAHQSKKDLRKQLKESIRKYRASQKEESPSSPMEDMLILCVILALFIPPLAVYLYFGSIGTEFWISLILTLLFFLPGVIYSLYVILTN